MYKSSLKNELTNGIGAINVALPTKNYRDDGLCENLTSNLQMSNIAYFDVTKQFEEYKNHLAEIKTFRDKLVINKSGYWMYLVEVCDIVITTYDALLSEKYENIELIFRYIEVLASYSRMLYMCKDSINDECNSTNDKDSIEEFYKLIKKVLNHGFAFHFNFENLSNFKKI